MTPLRQRMLDDMQVRNLSPHTQRAYVENVSKFARHFGRSPAVLGPEEIRAYLVRDIPGGGCASARRRGPAGASSRRSSRAFLRWRWLAGGVDRFRCGDCGEDRRVAFSCKGRGFCASCAGRRMTERAAHLVDHVFPDDVPVRQWVLSLPPRIRYLLAWHHDLCKALVGVLLCEVNRHLRDRARARGFVHPRGGAVAVVQRFGGAFNLNIHVHALVLDGVFARAEERSEFRGPAGRRKGLRLTSGIL